MLRGLLSCGASTATAAEKMPGSKKELQLCQELFAMYAAIMFPAKVLMLCKGVLLNV